MNGTDGSGVRGLHLNAGEREQISIGLAQGFTGRAIGRQLNRPACTISREKLRHQVLADKAGEAPLYRGYWAQQQAVLAKRRCGRKRKLDLAGEVGACALSDHVRSRLQAGWSPKAIACRLKRDYPNEANWHLCAMTIYDAVYILPRNQLKALLVAEGLHQGHEKRRPRQAQGSKPAQVRIVGGMSIHERSAEVDARRKEMRDRFAKELGLSSEQRVAVDSVMARQAVKFREARERVRPTMDSLVAETQQRMDSILTPDQRVKMKAMRERMPSRMPRGAPGS